MARINMIEIAVNPAVTTGLQVTLPVGTKRYKIKSAGGVLTSIADVFDNYAGVETKNTHTTVATETVIEVPARVQEVIIGTAMTYLVFICEY